jgi:hypothetical protein
VPNDSKNTLLPDAAVAAIQDSVRTTDIAVDGRTFLTRQVFNPPSEAVPEALTLNTLKGLADFIKADIDKLKEERLAIQIVSEEQVDFFGPLFGRFEQRKIFAVVQLRSIFGAGTFQYGKFYDLEEFNIKLRTLFEATSEQVELLKLLGNIKEERVRTTEDDGISQTVIARVGIASVAEVRVPSPVELRPFRTFREVDQPASPFIIRLRAGNEDELPTVALYEADGGAWKLDAIQSLAIFFELADLGVAIFA